MADRWKCILLFAGDAEVMLEEFVQSAVVAADKHGRILYAKAGLTLLGNLWQSPAGPGTSDQLYRLPPGLLYQVQSDLITTTPVIPCRIVIVSWMSLYRCTAMRCRDRAYFLSICHFNLHFTVC